MIRIITANLTTLMIAMQRQLEARGDQVVHATVDRQRGTAIFEISEIGETNGPDQQGRSEPDN